jgi:hypothetical protein
MSGNWCVVWLLAGAPWLAAGDLGVHAQLVGGTVAGLPGGSDGQISLLGQETLTFVSKSSALNIPYEKINTLEYGQRVNRRYAEAILISPVLLLAKSRKHFVTIGYTDEEGRQQALIFRVSKSDVRSMLAGLEARPAGGWSIRMTKPASPEEANRR